MNPTQTPSPAYYHKVVDCQWACPAHTPVPEYIRLIAAGRYGDAYMINWRANVFPGVLGRVCDRPCEPACRRGRVENEPVAICRLKRVAADFKEDITPRLPAIPAQKNGKRIACIGGGTASLSVARDLLPLGYEVVVYDSASKAGGMVRSQIPKFRLPENVLDEEVNYILDMGISRRFNTTVNSLKNILAEGYDAIFVGTGAPRGRDAELPGRREAAAHIHVGIDWLASVAFGHTAEIARRVVVIGGGNTAMDCCRTAKRLGGAEVKVVVRSGFDEMKASPWEREDALHEGIQILNFLVPKAFSHSAGRLTGVLFEKVRAQYDGQGRRQLVPTGEPDELIECDEVLVAIGQENAFPWIEKDLGLDFDPRGMPVLDKTTLQSTLPCVFFGGDAAFGPENIITAVAQAHVAAISIDLFCQGGDVKQRPTPGSQLKSQKMGIHEWIYDNAPTLDHRHVVPTLPVEQSLSDVRREFELGFDFKLACAEAERCLNCDMQTVFTDKLCIECDACSDICPMDCITFTARGEPAELRGRLKAPARNLEQNLYVSGTLQTGRVAVKDEDVCLHCGLCAERCPTGAWDMQKFTFETCQAGQP